MAIEKRTEPYSFPESTSPMRPEVGTQAQFRKSKPPTYRYDSSLSPSLEWDEGRARERAESLLSEIADAESLEEAKAKVGYGRERRGQPRPLALRHGSQPSGSGQDGRGGVCRPAVNGNGRSVLVAGPWARFSFWISESPRINN
jgi:hypothetical protein